MPRHKRTWKERHDTPDRRTFVLQLYNNVEASDRFELEAIYLDGLASKIDFLIAYRGEGPGATSIYHNVDNFNCYVGTCKEDKVLIVIERQGNALDWYQPEAYRWCIEVANHWLEASGYPTLAGKQPPRPGATPSERVADSNLSTPTPDG